MKSKTHSEHVLRPPEEKKDTSFRLLFQNNPLPMWIYDLETLCFLDVNEAAMEHYGYSRAEFLKMQISDIRPPEDVERVKKHAQARRPRLQHSGEWRHCKKDGSIIHVEITSHKLTYEGHKAALVSAKDITENKLALKALAESEERYRNLVENSLVGIYQTSMQGKIIYVNGVLAKWMGFKSAKEMLLLGSAQALYKNPGDRKKIIAALKRDGAVTNFETQFVTRSGEVKWVWISASLKDNVIAGIVHNITESKRLEDSARAIEASYRSLFNSVAEAIYIQDRKGRFLDVNDGAAKMYGYPREFLIGKTPALISAPGRNDLKKVQRAIRLAFEDQPQEIEFWGLRSNGEAFPKNVRLYKGTYLGQDVVIALAQDITERKRAEEALRMAEAKYRSLVEHVSVIVYMDAVDQVSSTLYISPQVEKMLGYSADECVANSQFWLSIIHPDDRSNWLAENDRTNQTGDPFQLEYRVMARDGRIVWIRDESVLMRDDPGRPLFWQGVMIDITGRKQAEEALTASEAELRALFASMPDVVLVLDKEGRYLKIAPTNPDLLHQPAEIMLGKRMHEVYSRQKADELVGHIRAALDQKRTIQFEYALLLGDHITWFAGTTSPLTEDSVVWVGRDITARKLAEDALLASQELLKDAQRIAHTGSWELDLETNVLTCSDEIYRMFETDPQQFESSYAGFLNATHPDDRAMVDQVYTDSVKNKTPYSVTHRLLFPDGRIKFVHEKCETFYNAIGKPVRSIGTIQDITERKLAEDALQQRITELSVIYDASQRLQQILTPETLAEELIRLLEKTLKYEYGAVLLIEKPSGRLMPFAVSGQGREIEFVEAEKKLIASRGFRVGHGITGWVAEHEHSVCLGDVHNDPRYYGLRPNVNSELCVPLRVGDQVIGVVNVESARLNAFTESDQRLLETIAAQIAIAIQNARLFEAEHLRRQEAETLRNAANMLTSSLDLEDVLNGLLDGLALVVPFNSAAVFLNEDGNYRAIAARGFDSPEQIKGQILPGANELAYIVEETCRPLILPDAKTDDRFVSWGPTNKIRGWMGVPLVARDQAIGFLTIDSHHPNAFTDADSNMALAFASHAAAAIQNASLYQDALRRMSELQALHESGLAFSKSLDPREVSEKVVSVLSRRLNWHHAAVRVRRGDSDEVELLAFSQANREGLIEKIDTGRLMAGKAIMNISDGMAGWVIKHGRMINNGSLQEDHRYYETFPGMQSGLYVPIWAGGQTLGCISVESEQPNAFSEADERLLTTLASQAASALENARLFEQDRRRIKELESLNRASQALTGTLDLEQLLENVLRSAKDSISGAEKGTILLWDKDGDYLRVHTQIGYEDTRILELPFLSEKDYSGRAFREKRPILIENALAEYELPFDERLDEVYAVKSGIVAPLIVKDAAIGVIALDNATKKGAFTKEDLNLLMIFASSAASVIENARLLAETRRRAEEFEALYQTASEVSSQTDLQTLLDTIIGRAQALSGAAGSGLYLFDSERSELELAAINDPDIRLGTRLALGEGLSGRVAQIRQPLIVKDYQTWENNSSHYKGIPITSALGIPMLYNGELIGVLNVHNRAGINQTESAHIFTEQDINLLSLLANAAAGAVYSARLLDQTRRRLDELGAVAQVSSALRTVVARSEMLTIVLDQLIEVIHADGAALITPVPGRNELLIEAARGTNAVYAGMYIPSGESLSRVVIETGKAYTSPDVRTDARLFRPGVSDAVRAMVVVPLKYLDDTIGALSLIREEKDGRMPPPFSEADIRLLNAIADMAANALQRSSLHEETVRYAGQLVIINDLGRTLSETLDLEHIYEKLARAALDLLPDTAAVLISLFNARERSIKTVYGLEAGAVVKPDDLPLVLFDEAGREDQSRVILSGEPLIVPDLSVPLKENEAILIKSVNDERMTRSALYVPMKVEGRVIGVLFAQCYEKNRYKAADAKMLELVANTAGAAIQNARLFTQIKRRVDQLSALHAVDTTISSTTDLRVSLQAVLENVTRHLKVDAADVLLLNSSTLVLQYAAGLGFFTAEIAHTNLPLGKGLAGISALERRIVRIPNLAEAGVEFVRDNLISSEKFVACVAVPLIAKGEVKGVLEIFQRSPLEQDDDWMSFLEMLAGQAALAVDNALLFEGLEKVNIELTMAYDATIQGWSQALELRDQETQGHSMRVLGLTLRLAAALGISDKEIQDMRRGVLLHDIGKMGIPDSILHKPGKLTSEEWEIMRKHPKYAYDMLAPIVYLRNSLDIPYCHHEKWDGTGYPRGLSGETIPRAARIFAIVDVYDALMSDRPYREAWSKEKTLDYIREQSGTHFDPRIVDIFLKLIEH